MYEVEISSSLIRKILYHKGILIVFFNNYTVEQCTHVNVPFKIINDFINSPSQGKFYLANIQKQFKLKTMADEQKPKKTIPGKNLASSKKRFIDMRIDVSKLNKDWFFLGENGSIYTDITLQLLPDGKVDKYQNLGMVTQKVPKAVYEKDKDIQGAILGNGKEPDWDAFRAGASGGSGEVGTGKSISELDAADVSEAMDDLPF